MRRLNEKQKTFEKDKKTKRGFFRILKEQKRHGKKRKEEKKKREKNKKEEKKTRKKLGKAI